MPSRAESFLFSSVIPVADRHWDGELAWDAFAPCGTPVLAVFAGQARAETWPAGGYTVRITADDGTEAYYAHLAAHGRVSGWVSAGQVIGYVSDSGNAAQAGCHVHFAVGRINRQGGGSIWPPDFFAGIAGSAPAADVPVRPGSAGSNDPAPWHGVPAILLWAIGAVVAWELLEDF